MVFCSNNLFFRFQISDIDSIPGFYLIYNVRGDQLIWKTSMHFLLYQNSVVHTGFSSVLKSAVTTSRYSGSEISANP